MSRAEAWTLVLQAMPHLLDQPSGLSSSSAMAAHAFQIMRQATEAVRPRRAPREPGRPPGGRYSKAGLLTLLEREAERCWRDGVTPTLPLVVGETGYRLSGLEKAMARHSLDWRAIKADAYRRVFGRVPGGMHESPTERRRTA